jgi:membrane associated rhomboid family serine protease
MIPLGDDRTTRRAPVASRTILVALVVVFLWQWSAGPAGQGALLALGFTPAVVFGHAVLAPALSWVPPSATFITYMFLHGGWLHLLGNVLYLWIIGDDVEDRFGHVTFIFFYLVCGICAAIAQSLPDTDAATPIVGASGAISGLLGAYLLLYPRADIHVLIPIFIVWDVVKLPAWMVLAFWFLVQLLYEWAGPAVGGSIAFRAHIGGFIAGLVMTLCLAPRTLRAAWRSA